MSFTDGVCRNAIACHHCFNVMACALILTVARDSNATGPVSVCSVFRGFWLAGQDCQNGHGLQSCRDHACCHLTLVVKTVSGAVVKGGRKLADDTLVDFDMIVLLFDMDAFVLLVFRCQCSSGLIQFAV